MALADALGDFGELDDGLLQLVSLVVSSHPGDIRGSDRHARIAQPLGLAREAERQLGELGGFSGELRILDRVDALRETDHETIDGSCQLGDVFPGRTDRWLSFQHTSIVIGRDRPKLERPSAAAAWRTRPSCRRLSGVECHACRREIPLAVGESVGFRDECPGCGSDLHACLNCAHHDPGAYNACREPNAERVLDPERANRCDYFRPSRRTSADGESTTDPRQAAQAALEALFDKD